MTAGVESIGDPTDRSTIPPGCALARTAKDDNESQGKLGRAKPARADRVRLPLFAVAARPRAGGLCG
jgi:hypothetical protein